VRDRALHSAAALSRTLHRRGFLGERASRAVRFLARGVSSRGTCRYRDDHGHLLEADLADYVQRAGFFGAHSAGLIRLGTSLLRPGDWVVDAGANVGLFASAFSAAVGPRGRVWAIEPLADNVEKLRRLKQVNELEQLEILPVALGSATATARLRLPAGQGSGGSFASFVATWPAGGDVEVPTCRLDDLVESGDPGRPLRLVKIDVEGFEAEVVAGAAATLATRRPFVLCEFHDPLLRAAGSSSRDLLREFAACGYEPRPIRRRSPDALDGRVVDLLLVPAHGGAAHP
jgi:FkbM family methyltransferase